MQKATTKASYVENIPSTSLQEKITKGIEEYENGEATHMAEGETINQFLYRLIAEYDYPHLGDRFLL